MGYLLRVTFFTVTMETFIYLNLLGLQLKETDLKKEILKVFVTQHILYQGRVFFHLRIQDTLFSSPELKVQVSFSDRLSSVVCLCARPSVCLSVNFSYFRLLLKNHYANFNQTWYKASLGGEDSSLFK